MQVHIGTYFGNPEDITIVGKLPEFEPITLEKHVVFDTLNFEWQTFNLVLRDVALSLPIYKNLYFLRRIVIRSIFRSELGMYRIIAHNTTTCKLQVLQDFKKLVTPKPISNPVTIERPLIPEPVYMEMNFDKPRIKTNPKLETELYTKPFKLKYPKNPRVLRTTMMGATADLNEILDECSDILSITDETNEHPGTHGTHGNNDSTAIEEGRYNLRTGEQKIWIWKEPNPNMDWIDYIRRDKSENFGMTQNCYDFIRDVHDIRNLLQDVYYHEQLLLMPHIDHYPKPVIMTLAKLAVHDYTHHFLDILHDMLVTLAVRLRDKYDGNHPGRDRKFCYKKSFVNAVKTIIIPTKMSHEDCEDFCNIQSH